MRMSSASSRARVRVRVRVRLYAGPRLAYVLCQTEGGVRHAAQDGGARHGPPQLDPHRRLVRVGVRARVRASARVRVRARGRVSGASRPLSKRG